MTNPITLASPDPASMCAAAQGCAVSDQPDTESLLFPMIFDALVPGRGNAASQTNESAAGETEQDESADAKSREDLQTPDAPKHSNAADTNFALAGLLASSVPIWIATRAPASEEAGTAAQPVRRDTSPTLAAYPDGNQDAVQSELGADSALVSTAEAEPGRAEWLCERGTAGLEAALDAIQLSHPSRTLSGMEPATETNRSPVLTQSPVARFASHYEPNSLHTRPAELSFALRLTAQNKPAPGAGTMPSLNGAGRASGIEARIPIEGEQGVPGPPLVPAPEQTPDEMSTMPVLSSTSTEKPATKPGEAPTMLAPAKISVSAESKNPMVTAPAVHPSAQPSPGQGRPDRRDEPESFSAPELTAGNAETEQRVASPNAAATTLTASGQRSSIPAQSDTSLESSNPAQTPLKHEPSTGLDSEHLAGRQPVREVTMQVPGRTSEGVRQEPVELRVRERAGEVQVAVRTGDGELAHSLRNQLGTLVSRLEETGYAAETFSPADAGSNAPDRRDEPGGRSGGNDDASGSRHGSGSGGGDGRQGRRNPSSEPEWIESLQQSLGAQQIRSMLNDIGS